MIYLISALLWVLTTHKTYGLKITLNTALSHIEEWLETARFELSVAIATLSYAASKCRRLALAKSSPVLIGIGPKALKFGLVLEFLPIEALPQLFK